MTTVTDKLKESINTMREFLDEVERHLNRPEVSDEIKIARTIHGFAWGYANASSSIENAVSMVADHNERLKYELQYKKDK